MYITSFEFSWSSLLCFFYDFVYFLWMFPLTNKSQVFEMFTSLTKQIRTQFSQTVKCFQCDNGGEYNNISFIIIALLAVSFFASLSLTLQHKMARRDEKFAQLTTWFALFSVMLLFLPHFGIMHLKWIHIFLTFFP